MPGTAKVLAKLRPVANGPWPLYPPHTTLLDQIE